MEKLKPNTKAETGCCERFDPAPWQEKEKIFKDRLFLKGRVSSFFRIPINMGKVIVGAMKKIQDANALTEKPLMLSDENSMWGSDIYIEVSKEIPSAENIRISGTFLTKVYEGPYKNMKQWYNDMLQYVDSKGKKIKKMYFFYTTCPRCAKYYGENYTVLLAQVA